MVKKKLLGRKILSAMKLEGDHVPFWLIPTRKNTIKNPITFGYHGRASESYHKFLTFSLFTLFFFRTEE